MSVPNSPPGQWSVKNCLVDLAVFVPGLDRRRPIVVAETDGHQFHERSPEQASKDRRRLRILQRLGIPVLPFTGTDVVRGSEAAAEALPPRGPQRYSLFFCMSNPDTKAISLATRIAGHILKAGNSS